LCTYISSPSSDCTVYASQGSFSD